MGIVLIAESLSDMMKCKQTVSYGNRVKVCASVGSWITLTEWDETDDEYCDIITRVKTELVDGVKINGDTWYTLFGGKFVEIEENTDLTPEH